jgi:hydroxymethylpyrimidine pyrophosphatase-like HAD family hydrolase
MIADIVNLRNTITFFDLAGTLVASKASFLPKYRRILHRLIPVVRAFVLTTGQPISDPQVSEFIDVVASLPNAKIVLYTCGGGMRSILVNGKAEVDEEYMRKNQLDEKLYREIDENVAALLNEQNIKLLVPYVFLDRSVVRLNIEPERRTSLIELLRKTFSRAQISEISVHSEGRTSIYVMRLGINKKFAVINELGYFIDNVPTAWYFGNEFEDGNDREVLDIPMLHIGIVGSAVPKGRGSLVCRVGDSPDDLYAFLERAIFISD